MNLLELAKATQECESLFEEQEYLTTEQIQDLMDMKGDIRIRLEEKVDRCIAFKKFVESRVEMLKQREKEFNEARKTAERTLERFKEYLLFTVRSNPETEFKGRDGKLCLQNNPASVQSDVVAFSQSFGATIPSQIALSLPEEYVERTEVFSLKKDAVKRDLAAGKKLSWARLEQGQYVRVRV